MSLKRNGVYLGDCLDIMGSLDTGVIDMVLCDLRFGVTKNRNDKVIPPEKLWYHYNRVVKDNGVIILFGQNRFTATMILSSKYYRYSLVWDKVLSGGFLNANKMPLRSHEDMMVFYRKPPVYNPQKVLGKKSHGKGVKKETTNNNYGKHGFVDNTDKLGSMKHPVSIVRFSKPHPSVSKHPTEKPVELVEWLVKTFSNPGDLVLDNAAGSGVVGQGCVNTGRDYILIEKDRVNCDVIYNRLTEG